MTSEHPLWVCGVYMYWYMFTNDPVARDVPQRAIIWLLGGAGPAEPIKCNKTIPFPLASVTAAWFPIPRMVRIEDIHLRHSVRFTF